jgi:heme oxygenase
MKSDATLTLDLFLKEETAAKHRQAEEALSELDIMGDYNSSNYCYFLTLLYYWHKTLEDSILKSTVREVGYNYQLKCPLILKDLNELNGKPPKRSLPELRADAHAGIIYTIEGSMMGGTMINRHLKKQGVNEKYRNYLSYCDRNAPAVWPEVKAYLRSLPGDESYFEACAESSKACFDLMIDYADVILKTR